MTKHTVILSALLAMAPAAGWAADGEILMPSGQPSVRSEPVIIEQDGSSRSLSSTSTATPEQMPGRVSGEVLSIEKDDVRVKGQGGDEVRLSIGTDLNPGLKAGDKIEATVDRSGQVESLDRLVPGDR